MKLKLKMRPQNLQKSQKTKFPDQIFLKNSKMLQTPQNASRRIRMDPNASEQVRTGPNRSENSEKLAKTSKIITKIHETNRDSQVNFARGCREFDNPRKTSTQVRARLFTQRPRSVTFSVNRVTFGTD